jgi:hypothetical protein
MFNVGNTLGCIMPGFTNISNDNAGFNPPILNFGLISFFGVSFAELVALVDVADPSCFGALDVAVLVWLDVLSCLVSCFGSVVGAGAPGTDTSCGVGAGGGAETLGTPVVVGVVTTVAVGLITLVGFTGLTGETGDVTLVGFDIDFTHVLVVVVHGPITGDP